MEYLHKVSETEYLVTKGDGLYSGLLAVIREGKGCWHRLEHGRITKTYPTREAIAGTGLYLLSASERAAQP